MTICHPAVFHCWCAERERGPESEGVVGPIGLLETDGVGTQRGQA